MQIKGLIRQTDRRSNISTALKVCWETKRHHHDNICIVLLCAGRPLVYMDACYPVKSIIGCLFALCPSSCEHTLLSWLQYTTSTEALTIADYDIRRHDPMWPLCLSFQGKFLNCWEMKISCIHGFSLLSVDASKEDSSLGRLVSDDHLNPRVKKMTSGDKPHLFLLALRDIFAGEKIT